MGRRKTAAAAAVAGSGGSGYVLHSHFAAIGWILLSLGLQSLIFPPLPFWPLGFACLAPWLIVVGGAAGAKRVYLLSYLLGFVFYLINMYWMYFPTGAGYVALSAYLAAYYPLMACPLRHAVRRNVPLAISAPFVWVGAEMIRALLLSGFPWFLLGHSAYRWLSLIQISDLAGAYGVSFVLASVNGAVADAWMRRRGRPRRADGVAPRTAAWRRPSVVVPLTLLLATLGYGQVQLHRSTKRAGPRVAILQGDYPNYVDRERAEREASVRERMVTYFRMLNEASAYKPDLYLLPETPWEMFLNREFLELDTSLSENARFREYQQEYRALHERFQAHATANSAYVVTGAMSLHYNPYDLLLKKRTYNSAFVFAPDGGDVQRYDKVHLVMFGEAVPFRFGHLRFLYLWLNRMTPFGEGGYEYSLTPGSAFKTFAMRAAADRGPSYRFGIPICYEDVMPYVARRFVTGGPPRAASTTDKQVDFLLNISNDGWFVHSTELPQHLAISAFRAVENRLGIARAVNTGISAFIDSDGRIYDRVERDGRTRGDESFRITGFRVNNVTVDSRLSLYSRYGDVFAWSCVAVWTLLLADYVVARFRAKARG